MSAARQTKEFLEPGYWVSDMGNGNTKNWTWKIIYPTFYLSYYNSLFFLFFLFFSPTTVVKMCFQSNSSFSGQHIVWKFVSKRSIIQQFPKQLFRNCAVILVMGSKQIILNVCRIKLEWFNNLSYASGCCLGIFTRSYCCESTVCFSLLKCSQN